MIPVLIPLARGLTIAETARLLYMHHDTVNMRLVRLRRTVGARNTTHLIAMALRRGWIT